MFDINFYEAVIGFVDLNNTFKQKPQAVMPSKTVGGKTRVNKVVTKNTEKFHTFHNKLDFNYYMKTYFKYFNMRFPKSTNK